MSTIPSKRSAPIDIRQQIAEARKRAEETAARYAAQRAGSGTPTAVPSPPAQNGTSNGASPAPAVPSSGLSRLEAMKARVAAATAKVTAQESTVAPPSRPPPQQPPVFQAPSFDDFSRMEMGSGARGGLAIGIHPALLGETQDKAKKEQKAKGKSKKEEDAKRGEEVNPYISEGGVVSGRAKRSLNFTHNMNARPAMQAANELRRKAALEQMKKRIQAQASRAGLDDSAEAQAFAVPMPPDVEFWDEGLQGDLDNNELISRLIVHPILIEPPQDKFTSSKPHVMYLTRKEQRKMRRIRRAEEHKEEQAKIRLGLVPTPAPKIKHSNVMRVYGEMAVKDPTAVEAMVNKQVAERKQAHEEANSSRQLTKEEKAEKIKQKAQENAALGLNLVVFRIAFGKDKLLGKHRYLLDVNAKQLHDLTGFIIVAPTFSLCIVEAGEHSTRAYKKLLLRRIKWKAILDGGGEVANAEAYQGVEDDTCVLLHQGQIRERKFKKWGGFREVESEQQGRDALTRAKLENFWTQAKAMEKST